MEEGAYLAILDNEINSNNYDGIYILEIERGSEALIQGNNAISGNDYGIYVEYMDEGGKLDIIDNLITSHDSGGVYVGDTEEGSEVNVLGNTITGNTGIGHNCLPGSVGALAVDSDGFPSDPGLTRCIDGLREGILDVAANEEIGAIRRFDLTELVAEVQFHGVGLAEADKPAVQQWFIGVTTVDMLEPGCAIDIGGGDGLPREERLINDQQIMGW